MPNELDEAMRSSPKGLFLTHHHDTFITGVDKLSLQANVVTYECAGGDGRRRIKKVEFLSVTGILIDTDGCTKKHNSHNILTHFLNQKCNHLHPTP